MSQWVIKLCYKPYTKGENENKYSFPLNVKACVRYFLSNFYFSPTDSPSETLKNALYLI